MIEILSLYNSISNPDKQLFESKVQSASYKKGHLLLMEGDIQDKLFLVRKGLLMTYLDKDDKRKVIDFAYKNRFAVDIHSFSNQAKSDFCIECMEDSTIEFIAHEDLMNIFDASGETERAYRVLTEKILSAVIRRHLELSCLSIGERFYRLVSKRSELFGLVQHKYIASFLNIDPTNFSKLYKDFSKKPIKFY